MCAALRSLAQPRKEQLLYPLAVYVCRSARVALVFFDVRHRTFLFYMPDEPIDPGLEPL